MALSNRTLFAFDLLIQSDSKGTPLSVGADDDEQEVLPISHAKPSRELKSKILVLTCR